MNGMLLNLIEISLFSTVFVDYILMESFVSFILSQKKDIYEHICYKIFIR